MTHEALSTERFLRLPEVKRLTGLGATSIYARINDGTFPKPISLGGRSVAWLHSEIQQWIAGRIAVSRPAA